jgi:CarD family transcriptional regulator
MTVRTAARARTARPSPTPVKSTRKPAAAAAKAKPTVTAKRTVSTTSTARRPVSTPPAGRPKPGAPTAPTATTAAPVTATVTANPIMAHKPGPVLQLKTLPPVPLGPPIDFKIGDKAVHPKHGVGEITAIEHRELGGTKGMFYILKILDNGMKVMVPTNAASQAGLRGIMSGKEADAVIDTMRAREVAVDLQPWSRRFRAYTEMVQSGLPHEVAKVLRDMHRLKFDKDLSFGERHLLDRAKSLLMKELAFAKKVTEAVLAEEVATIFRA